MEIRSGNSGFNDPDMYCPCRHCIHSGIYGGYAAKPGYLCPYNKRLAVKAIENIDRIVGTLRSIIENLGIPGSIELKGCDSLPDCRNMNGAVSECPVKGVYQEPAVGRGNSGVSGEIQEDCG